MNCDQIVKSVPLYFYGELPPEEEERVEDHLDGCESCRAALEGHRALAVALDRRQMLPEPILLDRCRGDLMASLCSGDTLAPVSTQRLARPKPPSPTLGEILRPVDRDLGTSPAPWGRRFAGHRLLLGTMDRGSLPYRG